MSTEILILIAICVILTLVTGYLFIQLGMLQDRVNALLKNSTGGSIEDTIKETYSKMQSTADSLQLNVKEIRDIKDQIRCSFSKFSIITYNAYEDVGGKLSFILCLLNDKNDGIIINSLHSRSSTRTYAKEVQNGIYSGNLSSEEGEALSKAISQN